MSDGITVDFHETQADFVRAMERHAQEHATAVERERAVETIAAIANAIAWLAVADLRHLLGWTRRRWTRERRAWNHERRSPAKFVVVLQPFSADQRASILAQIRESEPGWTGIIADPPPRTYWRLRPRGSFAEYVGLCLAAGRVPMCGRRS